MVTNVMTVEEIAKQLKVSTWKVYQLLDNGDIRGFKVGRQWRIPVEEINRYVSTGIEAGAS